MKRILFVSFVVSVFLYACSGTDSHQAPDAAESMLQAVEVPPTPADTLTPTNTTIPRETPAPTETFTLYIPPSPTATWVIPTPNSVNANEIKRLARIPSGPEGCLPPCWNRLTPGISPASDIPAFLAQFGIAYSESLNGLDEHDRTLHHTSTYLPEVDLYYLFLRIDWREKVERLILMYQYYTDIYGEASYLSPVSLIEQLGLPTEAKLYTYKDWGGSIGLIFSEQRLAISYTADIIRSPDGEPLLCLVEAEEDPLITVILYDEHLDPSNLFFRPVDFQDQEVLTGLSLSEFIAELVIPRRCIPVKLPE